MTIWVVKSFCCCCGVFFGFFGTVLLCILATSEYLLLLLGPYHFCPLLCSSCMKYSLGISNFLEEISSLPHFIVFRYFFALITEEGFLISPCYLELCIQMDVPLLYPLHLVSLFSSIYKASSDNLILPFCRSFYWGWF